ncbi:uncharacterized protein LOC115042606 [Echeneis naucrates]|uniref:Uncharacterized LOC115042606 n=1 Tax=Echeneis naucrates TaxID=173247 RepID=A0A665VC82_ECHNA|nr:uncharacterized protein LOC115042606 [Echeneis naucrates]
MNIALISSLLGVATFALQVATFEESLEASVSVQPPGSSAYLGECVLLQCRVKSHCTFVKDYRWYRSKGHTAQNPRHLASGDTYSITAVTREDMDSYWCQAECQENKTAFVVKSQPVTLNVSDLSPPSLSLTPNTRQMLKGEHFTVQCPAPDTYSSHWKLKHFSPDHAAGSRATKNPKECGVRSNNSVFIACSGSSGLYWCEGTEGRTTAVNITVSYDNIILKTPAFPVFMGDDIALYCRYKKGNRNATTFFKNGAEIDTKSSYSSDRGIEMTIENVTQEDEGFYKCASHNRKLESAESWLSVRPNRANFPSTEGTSPPSAGSWKWIVVACGIVLLLLIPLTVWLVCGYQKFSTRSCWPLSKQDSPAVAFPATKQDVTEVQWDVCWMEMSNLLDK